VELDGKVLDGVPPFTVALPPTGTNHKVRVLLDGYELSLNEFLVPLSAYTVDAMLQATRKVTVVTDPPGATVAVDGARVLDATPGTLSLRRGPHTLLIESPGHAHVKLKLAEGAAPPAVIKLSEAAYLKVDSDPPGAAIWVDGVDSEHVTPQEKLEVSSGVRHKLRLTYQRLASDATWVKAQKAGQTLAVAPKLKDQDVEELEHDLARTKAELARWQTLQAKYAKADEEFMVKDVKKAARNSAQLKEADEKVEQLSTDLSELESRVEDMKTH
jgi:hypothetical protein